MIVLGSTSVVERYVVAVDLLQAQAAAIAALIRVAHDEIGIDDRARASAVGQVRRAVEVRNGVDFASATVWSFTFDDESAAVSGQRRVRTLIEENRVVLDVSIIDEPVVGEATAVTAAQIAAHPVVVEFVIVGAGAEGDSAGRRRSGRVQFVAVGRIADDIVVVHVHVMSEQQRFCH